MPRTFIKSPKNHKSLIAMLFSYIKPSIWHICEMLPDRLFISLIFRKSMGYFPNLNQPKTYNEKIQWLKLNDRKPEYHEMVDKYEVRKFVSERIGSKYLIDLYGLYNSSEEIDFCQLPNQFVMKSTHGSHSVYICKNKTEEDYNKIRNLSKDWFNQDIYTRYREWAYKGLKKRIIAEKLLVDSEGKTPDDYKIMCFNGKPMVIQHHQNRFGNYTLDYYDCNWKRLSVYRPYAPNSSNPKPKPINLENMVNIAKSLSKGIKFVRVDLYNLGGIIKFGEMTFYPTSGLTPLEPPEWDILWGQLIDIS